MSRLDEAIEKYEGRVKGLDVLLETKNVPWEGTKLSTMRDCYRNMVIELLEIKLELAKNEKLKYQKILHDNRLN